MSLETLPKTYGLTPAQEQVIAAITGGATLKAAAEAAAIHRNSISYWRQTSLSFREALSQAQYDKAVFIREEAETRVDQAFAVIDAILADPNTSASARLNAAKYIIDKASTPPPPKPETVYQIEKAEIVHNPAQSPAQPDAPPPILGPKQPIRTGPKTGRNELCPCGSHLKFKRCCLNKPHLSAAA